LEGPAAHFRQLCAVTAAAAGATITAEQFALEWAVGRQDAPRVNLLPPADGLAILAGRLGAELEREPG